MRDIILATLYTVGTGIFGHIIFYPIIEAFHNQRMRRLARPAIGVLLNVPAFLIWMWVFMRRERDGEAPILAAFAAYCVSFLWNGAGVALGYLLGDWRES